MSTSRLITAPTGAAGTNGVVSSGSSFPGSPATNSLFYRTDLGQIFYYDGTRWLSQTVFLLQFGFFQGVFPQPLTVTTADAMANAIPPLPGMSDIYLLSYRATIFVAGGGSALSGSNKWVGTTHKYNSAASPTTIATTNIDSGASSTIRTFDTTINALLTTGTYQWIETTWTKTGTPGGLFMSEVITYRMVAV